MPRRALPLFGRRTRARAFTLIAVTVPDRCRFPQRTALAVCHRRCAPHYLPPFAALTLWIKPRMPHATTPPPPPTPHHPTPHATYGPVAVSPITLTGLTLNTDYCRCPPPQPHPAHTPTFPTPPRWLTTGVIIAVYLPICYITAQPATLVCTTPPPGAALPFLTDYRLFSWLLQFNCSVRFGYSWMWTCAICLCYLPPPLHPATTPIPTLPGGHTFYRCVRSSWIGYYRL